MKVEKSVDLMEIRAFYQTVDQLLKIGKNSDALKVLYEAMPNKLYDKSLDILYNRNDEMVSKSLRKLIKKVDNIINPVTIAERDEFINSKDKEWYEPNDN